MKALLLIGSPRKNGNTSELARKLTNGLDHQIRHERIFLYDAEIRPCADCRACKKGDRVCILQDDMPDLYTKIEEADIIIIGTPIYWYGPSAQTKLFLDRLRSYYGNKKLKGKKAALLLPAGTGPVDCDLTIEMFKRSFDALGIQYISAVTAKAYDIGDILEDQKALQEAAHLADTINRSL